MRAAARDGTDGMQNALTLARGGLAAFFDWWFHELGGLIPRRLRRSGRRERDGLTLALRADGFALLSGAGEAERELAVAPAEAPERLRTALRRIPRRRRGVTVRLAPELGLRKTLELPLAAQDDLDQLLRFEMDRLTPFPAEEVCFACRVLSSDAGSRRMSVMLQVAPRSLVEDAVAAAEGLGLQAQRVELGGADWQGEEALDLLPRDAADGPRTSRLNRALALLALALAAAAVVIPLQQQRSTADDLERQVAAARAEAEQSLALRDQLDALVATARFVVDRKTGTPMSTRILAELTRLIPDQAYVNHLYMRDGEVQLQGFAQTASDLIGVLDQSSLFRAPQFRSPVTRDARTDLERFHIAVQIGEAEG
jgi:general secretion pathway protein L